MWSADREKRHEVPIKSAWENVSNFDLIKEKVMEDWMLRGSLMRIHLLKSMMRWPFVKLYGNFQNNDLSGVNEGHFIEYFISKFIPLESVPKKDGVKSSWQSWDICIIRRQYSIKDEERIAVFTPDEFRGSNDGNLENTLLHWCSKAGDDSSRVWHFDDLQLSKVLSDWLERDYGIKGVWFWSVQRRNLESIHNGFFAFKYWVVALAAQIESSWSELQRIIDMCKNATAPGWTWEIDPNKIEDPDLRKYVEFLHKFNFTSDAPEEVRIPAYKIQNTIENNTRAFLIEKLKSEYEFMKNRLIEVWVTEVDEFWSVVDESIMSFKENLYRTLA